MELREILLWVQMASALVLVTTAYMNVLNLREIGRYKKELERDYGDREAIADVVAAAMEWDEKFGTRDHPMAIGKLRGAISEYRKLEEHFHDD